MRRNMILGKVKQNKGFTLMETLIVVGIMTVLAAVSFLAIGDAKETMDMTELDGYAKSVYLEAQNRLSAIEVEGGMPELYDKLTEDYGDRFLSADENKPKDYLEADEEWKNICYITRSEAVSVGLMPASSYSSSQMDGDYIIELNAQTGDVYGVFYCESAEDFDYDTIEGLASRDRSDRKASGLGYYGGNSMNTIALLENAPASEGGDDNTNGEKGGFLYYEEYEDGTYGAFIIGDLGKRKIFLEEIGNRYDYDAALRLFPTENTLRNEKCVSYGFAMFPGNEGYWRYAGDVINYGNYGGVQTWPLITESGSVLPSNIVTSLGLTGTYYRIGEVGIGAIGAPKTDDPDWYAWGGQSSGYYMRLMLAYIPMYKDNGEPTYGISGDHFMHFQLTEFLNVFLEKRYNALKEIYGEA